MSLKPSRCLRLMLSMFRVGSLVWTSSASRRIENPGVGENEGIGDGPVVPFHWEHRGTRFGFKPSETRDATKRPASHSACHSVLKPASRGLEPRRKARDAATDVNMDKTLTPNRPQKTVCPHISKNSVFLVIYGVLASKTFQNPLF